MSLKLEKALPGAMLGWGGKFVSLSFWCFGQTSWNQCFIRADSGFSEIFLIPWYWMINPHKSV